MNRTLWIILLIIAGAIGLLMLNDGNGSTMGIENYDFSRLVWLGIIVAVVGMGLLRSGRPIGDMARNLGTWAVIILALIAGYQYRYELQDFASRVSAGLIPGSPLTVGIADGRPTVTLDKGGNGHFEARITVNGATIRAVIDTGATSTVLTSEDALAAGFNPAALNYSVPVSTANGVTNAAVVLADQVKLGEIVRNNITVLIAAPGSLSQSLLGMNFIGSLSGFDVRGDHMILRG